MNPSDTHHHALPDTDALALLHSVTHHLGSAIALVDAAGNWVFLSDAMRSLLKDGDNALMHELADRAVACIRSQHAETDTHKPATQVPYLPTQTRNTDLSGPAGRARRGDGGYQTDLRIHFQPMAAATHRLCLLTIVSADSEKPAEQGSFKLFEALRHEAITDPLTGLFNRRYLNREAPLMLEQAIARHNPMALILLDLDHFKKINDQYGHLAGDHVLRIAASRIRAAVRPQDRVCRYGGEEFLVLLPDTGIELAAAIAERIRMRVNDPVDELPRVRLSASAGVTSAAMPQTLATMGSSEIKGTSAPSARARAGKKNFAQTALDQALIRADKALYDAKAAGRDCIRLMPDGTFQ